MKPKTILALFCVSLLVGCRESRRDNSQSTATKTEFLSNGTNVAELVVIRGMSGTKERILQTLSIGGEKLVRTYRRGKGSGVEVYLKTGTVLITDEDGDGVFETVILNQAIGSGTLGYKRMPNGEIKVLSDSELEQIGVNP